MWQDPKRPPTYFLLAGSGRGEPLSKFWDRIKSIIWRPGGGADKLFHDSRAPIPVPKTIQVVGGTYSPTDGTLQPFKTDYVGYQFVDIARGSNLMTLPVHVRNVDSIISTTIAGDVRLTPGASPDRILIKSVTFLEVATATPALHLNSGTDANVYSTQFTATASVAQSVLQAQDKEFYIAGDTTLQLVNGTGADFWTITGHRAYIV